MPGDHAMTVERRVFVPMEDGTRIALTLYLPEGDGPFPAVLESLPYRKDDDSVARDHATYAYLTAHGIAGIRMDVRGTGASTGTITDEYAPEEQDDNLQVLRWAAAQEWCTGKLGMWGVSWGGFSALQTAMLQPRELHAIAPVHATHDRFACDVHYTGGSLHAAEQGDWPPSMVACNGLPPDPDIFGEGWFEEWMRRLDETPQWIGRWLHHQQRNEYWLHGSPAADYASIRCPTLLIGGWLDGYVDGMLALAEHLECPTRTVIGPWGHYRPATGVPKPTYDHLDLLARWFGHHLRGDDNGVMGMPAVTAFIRTEPPYDRERVTGYWRAEAAWPPRDADDHTVPLDGIEPTQWSGPQWVGSHAPAWDRAGVASGDSAADDAHSMVLDSAPFAEPLEILGNPRVRVRVTTDRDVGMVAARLLVVDPEGRSHLISRGNRNLAFPGGLDDPAPPAPGIPVDVEFPLLAASALVPAGWRIRLALAGADFPVVWPPSAPFTLELDPSHSSLVLPVVPPRPVAAKLDIPAAPDPPDAPVDYLESEAGWDITRDEAVTAFNRRKHSVEYQRARGGLTYAYEQWWTVRVHDADPGTTHVASDVLVGLERQGWAVSTAAHVEISGSERFEVVVDLTAHLDGEEVFRRTWVDHVERRWA